MRTMETSTPFIIPDLDDEIERTEIALVIELYRSLIKPDQTRILNLLLEASLNPSTSLVRKGILAHLER